MRRSLAYLIVVVLGVVAVLSSCVPAGETSPKLYDPYPEDGASDVATNVTLSWKISGMNAELLKFDVYLDKQKPPTVKIASDISTTSYKPMTLLDYDTTYYWRVVAKDPFGNTFEGPIWSFKTAQKPNEKPRADFRFSPSNPVEENVVVFDPSLTNDDYDSDNSLLVRWDFNGDGVWDVDFDSGKTAADVVSHVYSKAGDYIVVMEVKDSSGEISRVEKEVKVSLAPPQSLRVVSIKENEIKIAWKDASNSEEGYEISRDGSVVAKLPPNSEQFVDEVDTTATHTYIVRAYAGDDYSEKSSLEVSGTGEQKVEVKNMSVEIPESYVGQDITVESVGATEITLENGENVLAEGYKIYVSGADGELEDDPIKVTYESEKSREIDQKVLVVNVQGFGWIPLLTLEDEDGNLYTYTNLLNATLYIAPIPIQNFEESGFDLKEDTLPFKGRANELENIESPVLEKFGAKEDISFSMVLTAKAMAECDLPKYPDFSNIKDYDGSTYNPAPLDPRYVTFEDMLNFLTEMERRQSEIAKIHINPETMISMVNLTVMRLAQGNLEPLKLFGSDQHTVLAYGISLDLNVARISVYDPDYPGEEREIEIGNSGMNYEKYDFMINLNSVNEIKINCEEFAKAFEEIRKPVLLPQELGIHYYTNTGKVRMKWWNEDENATQISVMRKAENSKEFDEIATLESNIDKFEDTVLYGKLFIYKITTSNGKTSVVRFVKTVDFEVNPASGSTLENTNNIQITLNSPDGSYNSWKIYIYNFNKNEWIKWKEAEGAKKTVVLENTDSFIHDNKLFIRIVGYKNIGWKSYFAIKDVVYSIHPSETECSISNPHPEDGEEDVPVNTSLSWKFKCTSSATHTFDLYLGTTQNPTLVASNLTGNSYKPASPLQYNTTYYWKVVAKTEDGTSIEGPLWHFKTREQEEKPDHPPTLTYIYPENGAKDVPLNLKLKWHGDDPDGDRVSYTVYLGTSVGSMVVIASDIEVEEYELENLEPDTTYYWKVRVTDENNYSIEGPVWKFETRKENDED